MAQTIQFRRGNEQNLPSLAPGEPAVTLDTKDVYVGTPNGNVKLPKVVQQETEPTDVSEGTLWLDTSDSAYQGTVFQALETQLAQTVTLINPTMSRIEIQEKLDNGGDFKFVKGTYTANFDNTGSHVWLNVKSSTNIQLEKGVVINAETNNYDTYYIFNINGVSNVSISGGMIVGDRSTHTGSTGEWGHGIRIFNSKNVTVHNCTIKDCWGDGIYVNDDFASETVDNNIFIRDNFITNCRRQGISIITINGVRVQNCRITNINGTNPQTCIDIEQNDKTKVCKNIYIEDCYFAGSVNEGVKAMMWGKDIYVRGCLFDGVGLGVYDAEVVAEKNTFKNTYISNRQGKLTVKDNYLFDTIIEAYRYNLAEWTWENYLGVFNNEITITKPSVRAFYFYDMSGDTKKYEKAEIINNRIYVKFPDVVTGTLVSFSATASFVYFRFDNNTVQVNVNSITSSIFNTILTDYLSFKNNTIELNATTENTLRESYIYLRPHSGEIANNIFLTNDKVNFTYLLHLRRNTKFVETSTVQAVNNYINAKTVNMSECVNVDSVQYGYAYIINNVSATGTALLCPSGVTKQTGNVRLGTL